MIPLNELTISKDIPASFGVQGPGDITIYDGSSCFYFSKEI